MIEIEIVNWSTAESTESPSTASENVKIFDENFQIPQLDRQRTIRVYLPPNYHNSEDNYPVLYMHDGQNIFDLKTSYSGEWEVDETLDKLYQEEGFSLIVVAIDNSGEKRLNEYSPWDHKKFGKGEGMDYAMFIVNTLKPKIDQTFRTKTDKNNTAIMGSSMGGLISHYTALQYADVFGKAGVFSPSFWYSEDVFDFSKKHSDIKDLRLYFLAGGKEGGNPTFEGISKTAKDMNTMIDVLKSGGFPAENIISKIEPEGEHNEKLWRNSFEEAITWLFKLKNK
ncbi:MAG: alpha/beta hydrolase [Flavobacteriaceae bacterium]|nr:alpha/beta hydrolase [Flavobacteriaceae bacterium]